MQLDKINLSDYSVDIVGSSCIVPKVEIVGPLRIKLPVSRDDLANKAILHFEESCLTLERIVKQIKEFYSRPLTVSDIKRASQIDGQDYWEELSQPSYRLMDDLIYLEGFVKTGQDYSLVLSI